MLVVTMSLMKCFGNNDTGHKNTARFARWQFEDFGNTTVCVYVCIYFVSVDARVCLRVRVRCRSLRTSATRRPSTCWSATATASAPSTTTYRVPFPPKLRPGPVPSMRPETKPTRFDRSPPLPPSRSDAAGTACVAGRHHVPCMRPEANPIDA